MKTYNNIPLVLVLTVLWSITKTTGVSTSITSVVGIILLLMTFSALAFEFFKSGDIGLKTFSVDTAFSIVQTIICTSTVSVLLGKGLTPTIPDLILFAAVLLDAWMSPVNSFRTALRNFATQSSGPSEQ
jgi:hypothetical protein